MSILQSINGHDDLVKLNDSEREQLCAEIRSFLVDQISRTGGHLASNLGVVELSVALETVFDTRSDRLVFDVGHQSYVHKLLTGRQEEFSRLRQFGGIAGFPKPGESDTDAFVAGHASSSVSIALGMARARTLQQQNYHVVAVMGDGAATGGMIYEGLNDAADSREPMIVILNDNEMSIDRNVGGLSTHLRRLRTKERYLGSKDRYRHIMATIPGGKSIYKVTSNIKNWLKRVLLPATMFENMGFTYYGPVDGHDLPALISLLRSCKDMKEPVLIHVLTQKGRGYTPAEENPSTFHGIGVFDPDSGAALSKGGQSFSSTFGETLMELAGENDKICAITAAMPGGTGLLDFKNAYPKRLFDVGIAEEHAVSMAGGLAKQGMVPVVALYSTFLQRAFDQILQDIALLKLHVVLAVDRAGLVGDDGETHHGAFDVGFLRQVPGMTLLAPGSCAELKQMLRWAVSEHNGPVAVRYPRGGDCGFTGNNWDPSMPVVRHRTGKDVTIITYGTMLRQAINAAELLEKAGISATVLRLTRLTDLSADAILPLLADQKDILILEETANHSGIHGQLTQLLCEACSDCRVISANLGDAFVPHGKVNELYQLTGLDAQSIANTIQEAFGHEN